MAWELICTRRREPSNQVSGGTDHERGDWRGGGGGGGRVCIQIVEDSPYQRTTLKDYLFILTHQLQSDR